MDKLLALTTLLEVADSGGFAKAARRLGVATSSVMRLMDSLEASLGAALLTRTPRRVSLTDAGAAYVEQVSRLLDELSEADESVLDRGAAPAGALRITVPSAYCRAVLGPHLAAFVREHPRVALDVLVADHFVDLALERIDVAVRIGAPARDPNLIVRTLQENPRWLVASADYLARAGKPATPADLAEHECARISYAGGYRARQAWTFARADAPDTADDSTEVVNVRGRLVTNNVDMLHEAVRAGQGVALLPAWLVREEVTNAKLERLFADYRVTAQGGDAVVYAAWLPNRRHSSKVRALLAFLEARLV
ncbi:LysR family transcriptional regulator [Burkholderia sp. Ax-1719]|uniref:LysR family transcriptional regulator n=1 Tax=Burkholderia sp. Ax-1719 TaxID=2608334 RepID=UPI0014244AFA|nr:LysR family transcriptional regulator [Burkholderia sp. Ax-1719]NIE62391.1 LysR family transcriptional regulator [Burkholderia sp. Ax-1719]